MSSTAEPARCAAIGNGPCGRSGAGRARLARERVVDQPRQDCAQGRANSAIDRRDAAAGLVFVEQRLIGRSCRAAPPWPARPRAPDRARVCSAGRTAAKSFAGRALRQAISQAEQALATAPRPDRRAPPSHAASARRISREIGALPGIELGSAPRRRRRDRAAPDRSAARGRRRQRGELLGARLRRRPRASSSPVSQCSTAERLAATVPRRRKRASSAR